MELTFLSLATAWAWVGVFIGVPMAAHTIYQVLNSTSEEVQPEATESKKAVYLDHTNKVSTAFAAAVAKHQEALPKKERYSYHHMSYKAVRNIVAESDWNSFWPRSHYRDAGMSERSFSSVPIDAQSIADADMADIQEQILETLKADQHRLETEPFLFDETNQITLDATWPSLSILMLQWHCLGSVEEDPSELEWDPIPLESGKVSHSDQDTTFS